MIHITGKAEAVLRDSFKEKGVAQIRIFLQTSGSLGSSLAIVEDEPKESDDVITVSGFTMLIDKELHKKTKDVTIRYTTFGAVPGFKIDSEVPVGDRSGGGSASCGC